MVPNRHQTRLQHPSSCRLRVLAHPSSSEPATPLLIARTFLRSARPKESSPGARKRHPAASSKKSPKLSHLAPNTHQNAPTHPNRRRRTVRHVSDAAQLPLRAEPAQKLRAKRERDRETQKHTSPTRKRRSASARHRYQPRASSSRRAARPAPAKKPGAAPPARGRQKPF